MNAVFRVRRTIAFVTEPLDRTLEELENGSWDNSTFPSYVVTTCRQMRRKPLRQLTNEELRLGIGQTMSLRWLVPLALLRLQADPLASGDFYEGDLLKQVLHAAHQSDLTSEQFQLLDEVVERFLVLAGDLDLVWQGMCQPVIAEAVQEYKACRNTTKP